MGASGEWWRAGKPFRPHFHIDSPHASKLEGEFLKGAKARAMVQLKGHRVLGGMRASAYNAMPIEGVKRPVEYMAEFEAKRA